MLSLRTLRLASARPEAPAMPRAGYWLEQHGFLVRALSVTVIFGLWEMVARSGTVSPLFLSSPSQVLQRIAQLFASGTIWPHLRTSGQEALLGFSLAIAIGMPIGVAMGRVPIVHLLLDPLITVLYSSPTVAFLPLLIIWLGIGVWSKVVLVFVGAVVVIVVNTETAVASVDNDLMEMARSLTASRLDVLRRIVFPSAAPFILSGLRLAVGRVLIMVVVAELYASTAGLGYLIFQGAAQYDATLVFAGVTLIAGFGLALSQALRALERRLQPWRQSDAV